MENFGLDLDTLRQPAIVRTFRAWFEDWERENIKSNDSVTEARFLTKYKNLVFLDPDTKVTFTVVADNCEFRRGRKDGGWHLLCEPNDDELEMEGWDIALANELIAATKQADGVQMVLEDAESAAVGTVGVAEHEV